MGGIGDRRCGGGDWSGGGDLWWRSGVVRMMVARIEVSSQWACDLVGGIRSGINHLCRVVAVAVGCPVFGFQSFGELGWWKVFAHCVGFEILAFVSLRQPWN